MAQNIALDTSAPTHIGDILKKRREEMNLSLKEVENATSIRMTSLRAIEEGSIASISPVYAKGFVKQYANFLSLDGEAIVNQHAHVFPSPESPEFSYGIGTMEHRGAPGRGVKWLPNAFWVGMTFVMIISAWYLAKFLELI
ncbi:Uncharacterized protein AB751O23_AW_00020 [Chlamydiales bacterium SCGC AB-751-O23]|jgi:cytoskeletal protein RodZ|nr:Uncharacterized protein AB751O23_AW_00020 [Chlamydiales bacterium SCGC AB-751-O23]